MSIVQKKAMKRDITLKQNIDATVDKLVTENWASIICQANMLGYNILDCVVEIDLTSSFSMTVKRNADLMPVKRLDRSTLCRAQTNGLLMSISTCTSCDKNGFGYSQFIFNYSHDIDGFVSWKDAQVCFEKEGITHEVIHNGNSKVMHELFF